MQTGVQAPEVLAAGVDALVGPRVVDGAAQLQALARMPEASKRVADELSLAVGAGGVGPARVLGRAVGPAELGDAQPDVAGVQPVEHTAEAADEPDDAAARRRVGVE